MNPLVVRELDATHLDEAARVVGRGMRDNPLHLRTFGTDDQRRETALTRFFLPVLRQYLGKGTILGAWRDDRLAGVCGMLPPGRCQPSMREKLRLMPSVLRAAPRSLVAVLRWTAEWSRRDPGRAHWHLGPVAVDRELQGHGVGTAMMDEFCRRVDALGATAYLETDKAKNVTFYERYDFETKAHSMVVGVPNWFMIRSKPVRRSRA